MVPFRSFRSVVVAGWVGCLVGCLLQKKLISMCLLADLHPFFFFTNPRECNLVALFSNALFLFSSINFSMAEMNITNQILVTSIETREFTIKLAAN